MGREELAPVRLLVLTVTGRCNFACRYCYASDTPQEDMSEETALAALSLAEAGGARFLLQFSGGEPLLRFPLVRRIVMETERRGLDVQLQLQTNGSLLTRDIARWLFEHRVGIGLSLDGKPAVNDCQRLVKGGGSAAAGVSRGFAALAAEGVAAGLTCVVTKENVGMLSDIADMAYFFGNVRQVGFDILREQGRGAGMKAPDSMEMEKALSETAARMRMLERVTGRHVVFTQEERVKTLSRTGKYQFPQCYAMHGEAAFVNPQGDIFACSSLMGFPEFSLGDVHRGRDPERVRRVGAFIHESMAACRSCRDFPLCGGGCFSRWLDKDGHVRQSEAECAMKRFFIKKVKGI